MMLHYYGMQGWGMGLAWGIGILFLILVVFLIIRSFDHQRHGGGITRERTPLEVLKERYARGEIDKAEFEEKKRDLKES
ncbi:MAG: SHOCT domain-containing protein [Candidatus Marinimicrobia bacterium]|nr:SHOCT domain-containing protein [Candidatus Neomarinimicrobiota bacterium]